MILPSFVPSKQALWLIVVGALASGKVVSAQPFEVSALMNGTGGFVLTHPAIAIARAAVASAGDVNGDGISDILVGVHAGGHSGLSNTGQTYIVFGRTQTSSVNLLSLDSGGSVGSTNMLGFVINGAAAADQAGRGISGIGDVNGDGLADLLVGAPRAGLTVDGTPLTLRGRAYVVFGKTGTSPVWLSAVAALGSTLGFTIDGAHSDIQYAGYSVSGAGDVNGDGLVDFIIGAQRSFGNRGVAYVVFGSAANDNVDLGAIESGISARGFPIRGAAALDLAGSSSTAAGDVNGDGFGDVVLGAAGFDRNGASSVGAAFVVFGKSGTEAVELSDLAMAASTLGFAVHGEAATDRCGAAVSSAGDVNGDGYGDIIAGAWQADSPSGADSGRAYVVFGNSAPSNVELSEVASGSNPLGFAIDGAAADDYAGRGVSGAGDINGDGLSDLLVMASAGGTANHGRGYLVFGKTSSSNVELSSLDAGSTTSGSYVNSTPTRPIMGWSTSPLGDVNGDGRPDFAFTWGWSVTPTTGLVCVVLSPYALPQTTTYRTRVAAGNASRRGVGSHRFGDSYPLPVDASMWLDFPDGIGPGPDGSSEVVVVRDRRPYLPPAFNLDVETLSMWKIDTDRAIQGATQVTVRYGSQRLGSYVPESAALYAAPTEAGPFVALPNAWYNAGTKELGGAIPSLPAVIVASALPPGINGDCNRDGIVNVADLTILHNVLARNHAWFGPPRYETFLHGDTDHDGDWDINDANLLRDHLVDGVPLPP